MPDGELYPHITDPRCRALAIRGHNETIRDLIAAGKERAIRAMDELSDAFDEIEREAPGSMKWARLHLQDARSDVEAMG